MWIFPSFYSSWSHFSLWGFLHDPTHPRKHSQDLGSPYERLPCARLYHGYLGALETQCANLQFQEPRTKLWLFDALVTRLVSTESSQGFWRDLYSMIAHMLRRKASMPHDMVSVTNIQRYSRLALTSSKQLVEHGDNHCWYVETQSHLIHMA